MMFSPFDAKAFPQYGSGTTPYELFVQQTDASLVALLADAIDERWPTAEFAQGRRQWVFFRLRNFVAVKAVLH
jgi:hypothetical protein